MSMEPSADRKARLVFVAGYLALAAWTIMPEPAQYLAAEVSEGADGGGQKYKKYTSVRKSRRYQKVLQLTAIEDSLTLTVFDLSGGEISSRAQMALRNIQDRNSGIEIDQDGIEILGSRIDFRQIRKITDSVYRSPTRRNGRVVDIVFWTTPEAARVSRLSPANRLLFGENFETPQGSFIRGSVVSFAGDLRINGEVNHSVVSFGGDITIGSSGVIRDHAIALSGQVKLEPGANVYGHILTELGPQRLARRERPWRYERQKLGFTPSFAYNRVDGFAPRIGWSFTDADTTLPELKLNYGIGATSERQRGRFSIKQPLAGRGRLSLAAAAYKELKSDDDALIPEWQNTLLALISTTDYKNYYEAEGGEAGLVYMPRRETELSLTVFSDDLGLLPANPQLWSMFGGDKRFPQNYQGLTASVLDSAAREISGKRLSGLRFLASFKSKHSLAERRTDWRLGAVVEKGLKDFESDFEFLRYDISGLLSHNLNRYSVVRLRTRVGSSAGGLPVVRRFSLGGYRWLRGYEHKEFYGTEFWASTVDYGVELQPVGLSSLKFWLFYDVAQIRFDGTPGSEGPVYHSLGFGLGIGNSLRLNLARRLDVSDPDLRVAVEF
ncbi:MAG: BamA/TamA family outer membrane protein [Candidatus Zixiibacteriota bacterium]